jgi:hypothetical protein
MPQLNAAFLAFHAELCKLLCGGRDSMVGDFTLLLIELAGVALRAAAL